MGKLRELRKSNKLTIAQAAEKLKIPFETYRSYEIGRNQADYDTLIKLADFFGVSIDYLLGRQELSPEERAAGATNTKKISLTADEYEMLMVYRELGERFGKQAQKDYTTVGENMLKLK